MTCYNNESPKLFATVSQAEYSSVQLLFLSNSNFNSYFDTTITTTNIKIKH